LGLTSRRAHHPPQGALPQLAFEAHQQEAAQRIVGRPAAARRASLVAPRPDEAAACSWIMPLALVDVEHHLAPG